MTVDELAGSLAQNRVTLFLDGMRLRYRAPKGSLTPAMRMAVNEYRPQIIQHLWAKGSTPSGAGKCIICDRHDWVDEPLGDGRIRTTCRKCGEFVGYRPENFPIPRNPLAIPGNSRQV